MEPTITIKTASERAHCTQKTIYSEVKKGNLKAYKPGKLILIYESDFMSWWESKRIYKPVGRKRRQVVVNMPDE